jgi:hypothetical protein
MLRRGDADGGGVVPVRATGIKQRATGIKQHATGIKQRAGQLAPIAARKDITQHVQMGITNV